MPADALDLGPQILRARRARATAVLVWGRPATIAAAITAARSAGWQVPFFTPPTGADPFVRQQLANHPAWVDGLTFAGGRLTAEIGSFAVPAVRAEARELRPASISSACGRGQAGRCSSRPRPRCTPTTSSTCVAAAIRRGRLGRPGEGDSGARAGLGRRGERRLAWLQPAKPRRRRRRRRLLRTLPRHDLCPRCATTRYRRRFLSFHRPAEPRGDCVETTYVPRARRRRGPRAGGLRQGEGQGRPVEGLPSRADGAGVGADAARPVPGRRGDQVHEGDEGRSVDDRLRVPRRRDRAGARRVCRRPSRARPATASRRKSRTPPTPRSTSAATGQSGQVKMVQSCKSRTTVTITIRPA